VSLAVSDSTSALLYLTGGAAALGAPRLERLGLYHFAILLPARAHLGGFIAHLASLNVRAASADHAVSEALYLWDPDGLGIEVYADRPRTAWRSRGRELFMTTEPLDVGNLLSSAVGWQGMPHGTVLGHMHLHVGDLANADAFYHRALGFDKTVWSYPGALFLSAGGYHHHLGTNTWAAHAASRAENEPGLLDWELRLPTSDDVSAAAASVEAGGYEVDEADGHARLSDPWGTRLTVRVD
jgi:catechol 2,3-dioxygenase